MSTLFYGFSGGAMADPDFINIPKANINVSSKNGDAVTFGYKDMELFTKVGMGGHGDMWQENDIDPEDAILSICGFTDDIYLTGRFWMNTKLISFWDKDIESGWLEKLVNDMKNNYGFDLSDYRVVCEIYEKQCVAITPLKTFIAMAPNQNHNLIQKLQSLLNKKTTGNSPKSLKPFEGGQFAPQLERDLSLPFMENKQRSTSSVKSLMERLSILDDIKDSGDLLNESARDRKVKNAIKQAIPGAPEMFWNKTYNGKRNIEAFENKLLEEFNIDTPSHPGGINRRFEVGLARIAYGELHLNDALRSSLKPLILKEIVQYISDNESASYDDNLNGETYASLLEKYKDLDKVQDLLSNKKKTE